MKKLFFLAASVLLLHSAAYAWGFVAHRYINKHAVMHLPPTMSQFINQQAYLETHAVDPDTRRNYNDTSFFAEHNLHFLDMDYYPDYRLWIPRSLDSLRAKYGDKIVKENGVIPWVTKYVTDSLAAQLQRGDWTKAYQTAADLGHYVGDAHQPVHTTTNYDGQLTNQKGIHSRIESKMIEKYQNQLSVTKDSVRYIADVLEFSFAYLLETNVFVDSVMAADLVAKTESGWNGSGTPPDSYYQTLWRLTGDFSKKQIQKATIVLASLWYTAYVNAGLIAKPTNVKKVNSSKPKSFNLYQNFPNPFNPKTSIRYGISADSFVTLKIYDVHGKEVATLVNSGLETGEYEVEFDASGLSTGLYFYRLQANDFSATKKLLVVK